MELKEIREHIDRLDNALVLLLAERLSLMPHVAEFKIKNNLPIRQPEREKVLLQKLRKIAEENNIDPNLVENVFRLLIDESNRIQEKTMKR